MACGVGYTRLVGNPFVVPTAGAEPVGSPGDPLRVGGRWGGERSAAYQWTQLSPSSLTVITTSNSGFRVATVRPWRPTVDMW